MNNLLGVNALVKENYLDTNDDIILNDIELQEVDDEDRQESKFVDRFYAEVADAKSKIKEVRENTEKFKKVAAERFTTSIESRSKECREEINKLTKDTKRMLDEIKITINKMNEANRKLEQQERENKGKSVELRIRENQLHSLSTEFMEALQRYQEVNQEYEATNYKNIKRRLRIVYRDLSDEELDEKIKSGDYDENIFAKQLLNTRSAEHTARALYMEAKETCEDLQNLEMNMNELLGMMQDLYMLLTTQQDLIDNVEASCDNAAEYAIKAIKQIKGAKKVNRCNRRLMIIVFVATFMLIAIIVVIIVALILGLTLSGVLKSSK